MIIQLMLLLAASCKAAEDCPDNEACLFHFHCINPHRSGEDTVLATTTPEEGKGSCKGFSSETKISVRPITSRMWNITIHSPNENVGIKFGDSLTIMANQTDASFKEGSDTSLFPLKKDGDVLYKLAITSKYQKLYDIFSSKRIFYMEISMKNGSTSSKQPKFWQKIHALTPCDSARILDDCQDKTTQNCTELTRNTGSVECKDTMWLKTNESNWMQIDTVKCDKRTKYWALSNGNGTLPLSDEIVEVQCAVEQPAAWETSVALQPSEKIIAEKKKKEKEANDSLLDSPFVWVGIALVGLIAVAAVLLAIGYAYIKLRKNPTQTAKSTMSKTQVDYTQLSQDPSNRTGSNSGKETEKDTKKMEEPSTKLAIVPTPPPSLATQTPAAPPQETAVSRLDGPNGMLYYRIL